MCLNLSDYITPSGFGVTLYQVCYNHFNPSGLLCKKGLAELKELMR